MFFSNISCRHALYTTFKTLLGYQMLTLVYVEGRYKCRWENKNKNRTATAKIHTMPSHVCIHSTGGCCLHLTGEGRLGHLSRII